MIIRKPKYYDAFCCLASACPDSCCKEWSVQVDAATAARYRDLSGPLGDRLRAVLQEEDGDIIMTIENGRCPMWREDGLCRIQAELGETALCKTCRDFPRLQHDYGDFVELQLELSCPEAARLILSMDDAALEKEMPSGAKAEYDEAAMAILLRSRETALAFLKDQSYPVGVALAVLMMYGYAVQNEIDGGEEAQLDPQRDYIRAKSFASGGSVAELLRFFHNLEILTDHWRKRLEKPLAGKWKEAHRTLARYFVNRYWLQAVSDYDLVSRVKLTIVSCLVIKQLGGDVCQTAQLYSKEIENDADNVDAILDGAYSAAALTDASLFDLLLTE